jgi:hypothetical protein
MHHADADGGVVLGHVLVDARVGEPGQGGVSSGEEHLGLALPNLGE